MRAKGKVLTPDRDVTLRLRDAGLGDPLFFIDGSSFDISGGVCTDQVSQAVGSIHGNVTMVTGPSGKLSPLFNNARVDFGFLDPITASVDSLVCIASIRITPGFASTRTLVSMDNGTVASRIWRFGLASTGQYFSQFRVAAGSRGGTQSYSLATVEPRALVDKGAIYGMQLRNKTLQEETDYPDMGNTLLAYGPHPTNTWQMYSGGNSFLHLQSIAQSKLVLGASLNSSDATVDPFYGVIEWLGLWPSNVRGQGDFLNLCQDLLHADSRRVRGFAPLSQLHARTFYVDYSKWAQYPSFSSMTDLYEDRITQTGLVTGSIYSVRAGSVGNQTLQYYGEVVGDQFHTPANKSTLRQANYLRPMFVGAISGLSNSDPFFLGQHTYGKMLRDVTGLSPETPAPDLNSISALVRPGDRVLLSRRYEGSAYDSYAVVNDNTGPLKLGHPTHPTLQAHTFASMLPVYPGVHIGSYDPATGLEIVPEEDGAGNIARPLSQVDRVTVERGIFYFSPVAGMSVRAKEARVSSWEMDARSTPVQLEDSNASMYRLSSCPQNIRYTYPTSNTYPSVLERNRVNMQSEGGAGVLMYKSIAYVHNYTMMPVQVPVTGTRSKISLRHCQIMDTPGDAALNTGMVANEQAPGGLVVDMLGCYIGPKTNPVNNTGTGSNTSRTLGTYIIRNVSVHHKDSAYQMGRSRLQTENSSLAYPLAMVTGEVPFFNSSFFSKDFFAAGEVPQPFRLPYSIRQHARYTSGGTRVRDPARSYYYIEWKFFWEGTKADLTIEYDILFTVGGVFSPDMAMCPVSVYYTDVGGEYCIYRDDEEQHMGNATVVNFGLVETNTNDTWYRHASIPNSANHRSGKRVLVLNDVGRGFVTFRISPFTQQSGVYLSPVLGVS